ncbi:MAG: hypothetical protein IT372_01175 [Polyangiaceae bacterium]|nr:hypothetical protein [Polyangiaceae bacterium]
MTSLPPALGQAFHASAAELGMCSASRLFVRELAGAGGDELVRAARDQLGRDYPVFDFVAERFLEDHRELLVDPGPPAAALDGIGRLVVVGIEADFLDALVPRLEGAEIGLVTDGAGMEPDFRRVLANYGDRVEPVGLADIQRWAGRRSALLTYVYGTLGDTVHVGATWLRVSGPDVRTQFRSLVGWDIFGRPMLIYPRWLVGTSGADFSHTVGP